MCDIFCEELEIKGFRFECIKRYVRSNIILQHDRIPTDVSADVEDHIAISKGYEVFALKNARTLLEQLPYMFIEYSPGLIRQGGQDPGDFIRWLSDFGFNFYNIDGGNASTRSVDLLTTLGHTENLFLVKKSLDTLQPTLR